MKKTIHNVKRARNGVIQRFWASGSVSESRATMSFGHERLEGIDTDADTDSGATMGAVDAAIKISLGLVPI